jgi:hypothetical protein
MYHDFDTENSIRKPQICKPVTPQKTSAEAIQLRFFRIGKLVPSKVKKSGIHMNSGLLCVMASACFTRHIPGGLLLSFRTAADMPCMNQRFLERYSRRQMLRNQG